MRSVLISIQPKWCELICKFLGYDNRRQLYKKRLELRKSKPNCETPFKAYIYCTQKFDRSGNRYFQGKYSGKVIGEFICDYILSHCEMANADVAEQMSCVSREDILQYSNGKEVYGWHISDLVIYDKPKELSEFRKAGALSYDDWLYGMYNGTTESSYEKYLSPFTVTRPPQSWCYVEGCDGK